MLTRRDITALNDIAMEKYGAAQVLEGGAYKKAMHEFNAHQYKYERAREEWIANGRPE